MRVVIGEDEALLREGLTLVLEHGGFEILAAAHDGVELVGYARVHRPDLVVTDIRMPPDHTDEGFRAALQIRADLPHIAIVILSQHLHAVTPSNCSPTPVPAAATCSNNGSPTYQPSAQPCTASATAPRCSTPKSSPSCLPAHAPTTTESLDSRLASSKVLALIAQGRSNAYIARTLVISEKAVVQHTSHIYDELGLPASDDDHRRVLAVTRYLAG